MRHPASASLSPASRWPRPQQLLPVSATGGGRRRCTSSASGLTDGSRAVSTKKEDPLLELALQEGVFFRFGESNELHCFYLLYFYYVPSPAKVKRCAESLQSRTHRGQARLSTTSQAHFVRQGRVAAPSVCCAAACIPLAAAPTAPPCFGHWPRSSPLPLVGEPLAKRRSFTECQGLPSIGEVARRQP